MCLRLVLINVVPDLNNTFLDEYDSIADFIQQSAMIYIEPSTASHLVSYLLAILTYLSAIKCFSSQPRMTIKSFLSRCCERNMFLERLFSNNIIDARHSGIVKRKRINPRSTI